MKPLRYPKKTVVVRARFEPKLYARLQDYAKLNQYTISHALRQVVRQMDVKNPRDDQKIIDYDA